jgi:hypothetical protein
LVSLQTNKAEPENKENSKIQVLLNKEKLTCNMRPVQTWKGSRSNKTTKQKNNARRAEN